MAAPKQNDLGGDNAWVGGNAAIDQCGTKEIVHAFALCRLKAIAKAIHQPDPSKINDMGFEAILVAIENTAPPPCGDL